MENNEPKEQPILTTSNMEPITSEEELSDDDLDQVSGGIGSQSTGAGAGKVKLSEFTISKTLDKTSPNIFQ